MLASRKFVRSTIALYVATNIPLSVVVISSRGSMKKITREELKGMIDRKEHFVLIDARTHEGFHKEHIPGANSFPADHLEKELVKEIKKNETIVTYCSSFTCESSTIAAQKLEKYGYKKVIDFKGGLADWKDAGYPTEKD